MKLKYISGHISYCPTAVMALISFLLNKCTCKSGVERLESLLTRVKQYFCHSPSTCKVTRWVLHIIDVNMPCFSFVLLLFFSFPLYYLLFGYLNRCESLPFECCRNCVRNKHQGCYLRDQ